MNVRGYRSEAGMLPRSTRASERLRVILLVGCSSWKIRRLLLDPKIGTIEECPALHPLLVSVPLLHSQDCLSQAPWARRTCHPKTCNLLDRECHSLGCQLLPRVVAALARLPLLVRYQLPPRARQHPHLFRLRVLGYMRTLPLPV
jgi:hypothetical protein